MPFAAEDVDLGRLYVQTNVGEELIVNDVGSWRFRPGPTCGLPNLRLDPDAEDVHITGLVFRSPQALPVRFDPMQRA